MIVISDEVVILEQVIQFPDTKMPSSSTTSVGVQIPELILDFFDDSEGATDHVDLMSEAQAKEQLKRLILMNRELESASHSSVEADRLRIENEKLREKIEKKESEIGVKNYLLKTKDADLEEQELQTKVENFESLSHSKDVLIANLEDQVA